MKVRVVRDIHHGTYEIKFLLEEFTEEEIYLISRYGPLMIALPKALMKMPEGGQYRQPLETDLKRLPSITFFFRSAEEAKTYGEVAVALIKEHLDLFVASAIDYVGETVFEIRVGEEIRRISEGARKALDKDSQEYKEVIENNREAFEKLSKL